jgi:hypothetical protein
VKKVDKKNVRQKWCEKKRKMDITIGYLCWKKYGIFRQTLISHRKLHELIPKEKRIIFFQEIDDEAVALAHEFNCTYMGSKNNVGIMDAFIELVNRCQSQYFIFCENDFLLLNSPDFCIKKTLEDSVSLLQEYETGQVKLSNTKNPGFLYITPKNKERWMTEDRREFRYKIESLSWVDASIYPEMQIIEKNYKWYKVGYRDQNWSNHIYMCNTSFLRDTVLPLLSFAKETNKMLDVRYQGLEDTLNFPERIERKDCEIDKKISTLRQRVVLSGGGDFYHNKV